MSKNKFHISTKCTILTLCDTSFNIHMFQHLSFDMPHMRLLQTFKAINTRTEMAKYNTTKHLKPLVNLLLFTIDIKSKKLYNEKSKPVSII